MKITGIGFAEEEADFLRRHERFFERLPNLVAALKVAFDRTFPATGPAPRIVYFLGCACVEDFFELLVLCGDGYGLGAIKLMRGLYERAVTAHYLSEHPDEADRFGDFVHVSNFKTLQAAKRTIPDFEMPAKLEDEMKVAYERVRSTYVTTCGSCGSERPAMSWSSLDFVSMANRAGSLGRLIVPCYLEPTVHVHANVLSVLRRLEHGESGGLMFSGGAQRGEADRSLRFSHLILLDLLEVQKNFFKLVELERPFEVAASDFGYIWSEDPPGSAV